MNYDCHSDQLRANLLLRIDSLEVQLRHIALYNDDLAHAIQDRPGDTLPLFEAAAAKAAKKILNPIAGANQNADDEEDQIREVQIMIKSSMNMLQFRDLTVCDRALFWTLSNIPLGGHIHQASANSRNRHLYLGSPVPRD